MRSRVQRRRGVPSCPADATYAGPRRAPMKSRRTHPPLWLSINLIGLTAVLSLAPASKGLEKSDLTTLLTPSVFETSSGFSTERESSTEHGRSTDTLRMVAQASAGASGAGGGSGAHARRKVRVTDPEMSRQLSGAGGRLIADYGSFQVLDVDEATAASLAGQEGVEVHPDYDLIMLNAGPIDTTSPQAAALRGRQGAFAGKRLHLIQFAAPVQEPWLDAVRKTGVQVVAYIPANAFLVYGEAASLNQLQLISQTSPFVQWDGAYLDTYKIHPDAQALAEKRKAAVDTDYFAIQMVDDARANASSLALINSLKLAPIFSQSRVLGYLNVIVGLPATRLNVVARQPEVVSIQPYVVPRLFDERQGQIVAGNITGSGFAVDVSDDGLDNATTNPNHFGLHEGGNIAGPSRVVYARREPTGGGEIRGCFGHGTLNSHIIGGFNNNPTGFPHTDAAGFHYGLGIAPFVRLGSSVIFDPNFTGPDYEDLQSRAYRDGARISSNSWGGNSMGAYTVDSQRYDALVRDAQPAGSAVPVAGNQEMIIVFAAGNAGAGASTVGAPGTGKNVFTVGASENVHSHSSANGGVDAAGTDGCGLTDTGANSLNDIIGFSSRGPATDGRVRPDIVAPGTHVTGGVFQTAAPGANGQADACFTAASVCHLPGGGTAGSPDNFFPLNQQFFTTSSGTSHSTPGVAGGTALVRQWFINQGMAPASPAMTKAFLMNSARYMTGTGANDTLPSQNQGMGLMDLGRAFDGTARIFRDQLDLFTATGQTATFTGTISDPSKPFRVTLAWTDAPGNTTGNAFNNDLDLTVIVGGNVYKGNVFSGPNSVTGGNADRRNNVESVFLPAGVTGPFAVVVTAANINSDGVPNNGSALDEDFALVVYNGVGATVPVLALQSTTVVGGNGSVEPNECNDFNVTLKNWGTATATGVFATLATSTAGAAITQAGSAYPNIAAGATGTNTTPFKLSTSASFVCGTTVGLTATITTDQGGQTGQTGIASGSLVATNFDSTDVPKAIPDVSTVESIVNVAGITAPIAKVTVSFWVTHTFDADLAISLVGPDGTTVDLTSNNGGGGANFGTSCGARTVFDDAAATSITAGTAPFVGTFRPEQALSAFAGKSGAAVNGTWRLRIADQDLADVGTLQCWTLTITNQVCTPGAGPCTTSTRRGDFDGDGKSDILWRHTSGTLYQWLLNGTTVIGAGSPGGAPTDWTVVGVGDFNGDGKADILWRHTSGTLYTYLMNGTTVIGAGSPGGASTDWTVVGVGDFNGDGKADILFRHTSGTLFIYFLNGTTVIGTGSPGGASTDWTVVGVGDFNGDGKADILFRHTSGTLFIYFLNGTTVIGTGSPGGADPSWTVQ